MRILPYGDRAVLVEVDGPPIALRDALTTSTSSDSLTELVPAARTLLVRFDPRRIDRRAVEAAILAAGNVIGASPPAPARATGLVSLPVHYDGPDLADVAVLTGLSVTQVIERHLSADYVVAFCGFAPGFAYLTGLDPRLQVPRLPTPRTRVAAGAVGIAGEYTAAYPRSSPGGWRLIGWTDAVLWDLFRPEPALLQPGTQVRFEAAR